MIAITAVGGAWAVLIDSVVYRMCPSRAAALLQAMTLARAA